ncbi:MAG: hypothetical protein AAF215_18805 [Cyanobacteria bacterium P01_A01_bin.123]
MSQSVYDLGQAIINAGNSHQTIVLDKSASLTHNLEVPSNIHLIVRRNGLINLCGYQLKIKGQFEAGFAQAFSYTNPQHSFLETERVIFKARSVERVISTWFGTHPDNDDNSSALQRAIDSAYAICKVYIPSGIYKIKDTIHLAKHRRTGQQGFFGFQQFILEGASRTQGATLLDGTAEEEFNIAATVLEYDRPEKDRPLINIQFAIGTILRDLRLDGGLSKSVEEGRNGKRPNRDYWIESPDLVQRHNPYCAVATDAYVGIVGSNSDLTYPTDSAKGVIYEESGSGSQDILLERVAVFNFGVGVAIAPAGIGQTGGTAQNDAIYLNQCRFDGCTYSVAIGSTQARACHINNSSFYRAFAAITTVDFGIGSASLLNLTSNQYKDCRMLYRLTSSSAGPCQISGDYCENVIRLGNFGLISSTGGFVSTVSFSGCNFNFSNVETPDFGTLGLIVNNTTVLNFQGCTFQSYGPSVTSGDKTVLASPISELHLLSTSPGFSKFIFDGCSFRFPDVENPKNVGQRMMPGKPPIRVIPYSNPYFFNHMKSDVSFRDCVAWTAGSPYSIQLSNDLPIYLETVQPKRIPIHWSTESLKVSGGVYGNQPLALRNTLRGDDPNRIVSLPIIKVNSIAIDTNTARDDYHQRLLIDTTDDADLCVGDRLFWLSRFDFGEGSYADLRPGREIEEITTDLYPASAPVFVVTHLREDDDGNGIWIAEIPADQSGNPRIPYRDEIFPLAVTETETTESDSHKKAEYLTKAIIMPRSDFREPENSQYYVILNGSVQGRFMHGSTMVTGVTNIHLLEEGDFVNQDYVPSGTRIKDIDTDKLAIELTRPVEIPVSMGNESVVDHVPFCYAVSA